MTLQRFVLLLLSLQLCHEFINTTEVAQDIHVLHTIYLLLTNHLHQVDGYMITTQVGGGGQWACSQLALQFCKMLPLQMFSRNRPQWISEDQSRRLLHPRNCMDQLLVLAALNNQLSLRTRGRTVLSEPHHVL